MKKIIFILFIFSGLYAQCSEMDVMECGNDNNCEWLENIESVTCASLVLDEELCEAAPECTYSCDDGGGYFGWCTSSCSGGMTYIDSGYCQETEMPECSGMNEMECSSDNSCDWVENTEIGPCSSLSISVCDLPEYGSCYSDCTNWGSYYNGMFCYGTMYCAGGSYQSDDSYCEESPYQLGDINQDSIINIQDVIIVINLILNGEFDLSADLNLDSTVNVLDVIQIVNIILNN